MGVNLMNVIQFAVLAPAQFLVAGVWQGLLLTAMAWIGLKAFPKLSPRNRFILWLNVFVLAALLPFFAAFRTPALVPLSDAAATSIRVHLLSAGWAEAFVGLWVVASLLSLARLFWSSYCLWLLSRTATPIPPEALDPELQSILATAGSRPTEISLSCRVDSPVVIGFFHRVVVIPEWLSKKLTRPELKQVLIHELAHLKRRDDWTNLLQKFFRALFPLNPALILADRQLCREREMACDDAVLDAAVTPRAYATCLATLAEKRILRRAESLAPGAWRGRSELATRVHRILANNRKLSSLGTSPAVAAFVLAFLFAGVGLARCPQLVAFSAASNPLPQLIEARISQPAEFEQASFREVSSPREHAIGRRAPKRMLKHETRSRQLQQIEQVEFLHPTRDAFNFPVVLTLWEPLTSPTLPDDQSSRPAIAIFQSRTSWIVIQL